ncbi:TPA: hypothetical protein DCY43_01670 [candidate division WWE3 bacterium]|uniref:NAD-dependent epimerase/dehydratase domain-containing protein n=1 Tax=candidate division WWE3 bacterium TaxID=2053526 RepID=A0A351JT26_UNCKA|nr:hypothetical protein [candidate division WWE3 bacterium]
MISAKTIKKTALVPTVLISHGGGIVCSHLAETLLLKNCRVVVLSNFAAHQDARLHALLKSPKFALFDCDISQSIPDQIQSVDYIFHLASYESFVNQDGALDLEALLSNSVGTKNLLDLAKASKAKFALVRPLISLKKEDNIKELASDGPAKYSWAIAKEYRERWGLDVRVVDIGYVYGPGMDLACHKEFNDLVQSVISGETVRVYGDGSRKEFFIYVTDAVAGLVKALFSTTDSQVLYTLVREKPQTLLEAAFILKSLADGTTELGFTDSQVNFTDPAVEAISYPLAWQPRVELREGLIKTLRSLGYKPNVKSFKAAVLIDQKESVGAKSLLSVKPEDEVAVSSAVSAEPKVTPVVLLACHVERKLRGVVGSVRKRVSKRGIKLTALGALGIVFALTVALGVPLIQSYSHARSALRDLEAYQKSVLKLDSSESQKLSEDAYNHIVKLQKALARTKPAFVVVGKEATYLAMADFVESTKNFTSALYSLSLGLGPFAQLWGDAQGGDGDFGTSARMFKEAKARLDFANAYALKVDAQALPAGIRDDFANYKSFLSVVTQTSDSLTQTALDIPGIMGMEKPKTYLLLFQNNNELRPTGGFVGSYAAIKVEDGKITDVKIDDIYNPDGQLSLTKANEAHPAPAPVKELLGEDVLYLRNANWDPSFPASSETIQNLFKLSGESSFDGVIAVDLYFVRDLINITGPIYLAAYDEEIRADNMYERAQYHSGFNFKEGVSSKKAFMTVLGGKMLESLFALPKEKMPLLAATLYRALNQKHLLVNLPGTYLSKYLIDRGWAGELLDTNKDYLYVVNANLGGTKSNYFVKNSMNYAVTSKTADGLLRGELELVYENTQKDASWPGGPYKNYLRVLVQAGSKLTGAYVFTNETAPTEAQAADIMGAADGIDVFDKVVIAKVGKYVSLEYPVVVNPKQKVKVLITYDLPVELATAKGSNNYSLVWQKQPGTQNDNVRFMFIPPFGTTIAKHAPEGSVLDNIYEYKGMLNEDLRVAITYK